ADHLHLHVEPRELVDALARIPGARPDLAEEAAILVDAVAPVLGVVDHREAGFAVLARQVRPVAGQVVGVDVDPEHRPIVGTGDAIGAPQCGTAPGAAWSGAGLGISRT